MDGSLVVRYFEQRLANYGPWAQSALPTTFVQPMS